MCWHHSNTSFIFLLLVKGSFQRDTFLWNSITRKVSANSKNLFTVFFHPFEIVLTVKYNILLNLLFTASRNVGKIKLERNSWKKYLEKLLKFISEGDWHMRETWHCEILRSIYRKENSIDFSCLIFLATEIEFLKRVRNLWAMKQNDELTWHLWDF